MQLPFREEQVLCSRPCHFMYITRALVRADGQEQPCRPSGLFGRLAPAQRDAHPGAPGAHCGGERLYFEEGPARGGAGDNRDWT